MKTTRSIFPHKCYECKKWIPPLKKHKASLDGLVRVCMGCEL